MRNGRGKGKREGRPQGGGAGDRGKTRQRGGRGARQGRATHEALGIGGGRSWDRFARSRLMESGIRVPATQAWQFGGRTSQANRSVRRHLETVREPGAGSAEPDRPSRGSRGEEEASAGTGRTDR